MNYLQRPQSKVKQLVLKRSQEINLPVPILDPSVPWTQITGIFVGTSVIIEDSSDAAILLTQGCFGKKAWPSVSNEKYPILRKRQWKRRKDWQCKQMQFNSLELENKLDKPIINGVSNKNLPSNLLEEEEEEEEEEEVKDHLCDINNSTHSKASDHKATQPKLVNKEVKEPDKQMVNKVIVINDSDEDMFNNETYVSKRNPTICTQPMAMKETLYLNLEEAFFLAFALYCLTVTHMVTKKVLSLNELWEHCKAADSSFVEKYVTYHYFRMRGWIVKSGLNFGCDFALYKRGPAFYHASCLVKVRNMNLPSKGQLTWESVMGYGRVSEAAKKDFVLCEVSWPKNTTSNNCDIKDLNKFRVEHKLLQRWTASEHREGK